jgi:5-methyltetrahydrofolate--homocysteine methyltransferase
MVTTAGDLKDAGIQVPLLVGGAALSEKFTKTKIAPSYEAPTLYAKDAMTGLQLMNNIMDPEVREQVLNNSVFHEVPMDGAYREQVVVPTSDRRSLKVRTDITIPAAPYQDRRARTLPNLTEIWSYINPFMLFGRHLGYKRTGGFEKGLADRDPKALELFHAVEEIKHDALSWMKVRAVWQFFEAERDGNSIHLFAPDASSPMASFSFGRQAKSDGLCLSDYILEPGLAENGTRRRDHIAMFVVTAGEGVIEQSTHAKQRGEFLKAHALQALGIETAEACAEYIHRRLREDWGFPDPESTTMHDRFTSRYRGKRYSFGYPACPNLEDQVKLFRLLKPEDIGVHLTEGFMMEPEASVSALVFHHPDCAYFSAAEESESAA